MLLKNVSIKKKINIYFSLEEKNYLFTIIPTNQTPHASLRGINPYLIPLPKPCQ